MSALRVLLVDDDRVDRLHARRLLERCGMDVALEECGSQASALAVLADRTFDCLLLDYRLPGGDGLSLLQALRERGIELPVVALTGDGDTELAVEWMKAGAADYLDKNSMTADRLAQSLRHALAIHRAERERQELLHREQEARREAQAANRAKDEFLAVLSHELRTPLNAILGWADLLATGGLDAEKTRRAIDIIRRNTRMQAQLIDDLLEISRIVTGKLRLELEPEGLRGLLGAALESVRPSAREKGLSLEAELPTEDPPLLCDAARLQQVFWNLLHNAVKFTPPGGEVRLRCRIQGQQAVVEVADTGIGMEPDFLPHAFDRFRQQDSTTTRGFGGLGLGLAIVRHLVELHGGEVAVASPGPGRGSTFTVRLPLAMAGEGDALAACSQQAEVALVGVEVLVVDDEPETRELLREILQGRGALVRTAASVDEALRLVGERAPDVLVCDIAMPARDGFDLARELRDRGLDLPAVALTGLASAADRERALAEGFQDHLPKPVDALRLCAAVARLARRPAPLPP